VQREEKEVIVVEELLKLIEASPDFRRCQLIYGNKVIEPPYLIRKFGVSEVEYDWLTDEDTKADLFDGTLIIHSPASTRHETIFVFLLSIMNMYVEEKHWAKCSAPVQRYTWLIAACSSRIFYL